MKRTIAFLASFMCILSFTACGETDSNNSSESISENSAAEITEQKTEPESSDSEPQSPENSEESVPENTDGKTLVVYYSASGNTAEVAEYIAAETSGDLFEIEPVNVYSDADLNWTDPDSRVCYEYNNPDARDIELVSTEVADWDSYNTVFIGYPIWWGIAAWPVDNFVKSNDFSDKTVVPFCTSTSSGLSESGELLAEMAGTGNWQSGERFRSGASEDDVRNWVSSLNLD